METGAERNHSERQMLRNYRSSSGISRSARPFFCNENLGEKQTRFRFSSDLLFSIVNDRRARNRWNYSGNWSIAMFVVLSKPFRSRESYRRLDRTDTRRFLAAKFISKRSARTRKGKASESCYFTRPCPRDYEKLYRNQLYFPSSQ